MLRQAGLKGALWSIGYPPLKNQLLGSNLAAGWMVGWLDGASLCGASMFSLNLCRVPARFLPQSKDTLARSTSASKLHIVVNVSVHSCPVMNRQPVQGAPRLSASDRWDRLQQQQPCKGQRHGWLMEAHFKVEWD